MLEMENELENKVKVLCNQYWKDNVKSAAMLLAAKYNASSLTGVYSKTPMVSVRA